MPKQKTLEKEVIGTEGTDELEKMEAEAENMEKEMETKEEEKGELEKPQNPDDAFKNVSINTMPLEMQKGLCPRCLSVLEVVKEKVGCTNCTYTSTEDIKVKLGDLISLSIDGIQGDVPFDKQPEQQPKETMISLKLVAELFLTLEDKGCMLDFEDPETETSNEWMNVIEEIHPEIIEKIKEIEKEKEEAKEKVAF